MSISTEVKFLATAQGFEAHKVCYSNKTKQSANPPADSLLKQNIDLCACPSKNVIKCNLVERKICYHVTLFG